jgi:hypothetical protein
METPQADATGRGKPRPARLGDGGLHGDCSGAREPEPGSAGYYMLFLVNASGVPSTSRMVRVGP